MTKIKWEFDPMHSELGFKIKHLMITNVSGSFKKFHVEVETRDDDFSTAQVKVKVDMNSIDTNNVQRDEHLRNSDFFEVDKYPELIFSSTRMERSDDENFILYGDLTMKGVTKPVQLNVEYNAISKDPWGGTRAGFVVTGKINRNDWGVSFNGAMEAGGLVLGEDVKLNSEIQLVKTPELVEAG